LSLFPCAGAVPFSDFAPLFNDCLAIVKSFNLPLKFQKGEIMFTNKEKKLIGEDYFTIIRETERYIEFLSNNTRHCWIICKNPGGVDVPIMIYHKHSRKTTYYHKHWSVARAVESIKQHDRYVLGAAG
jgi:hypothetical protein